MVSRAFGRPGLDIAWRHVLHIALIALVQTALVAEQVLYLLSPLIRVLAFGKKCRLVRETLLLAEDNVALLVDGGMLHIPHQSCLKGALAHKLRVAAHRAVCGEAQAGRSTDHAAGKAAGRHETLLTTMVIRSNRGVKLPILRISMLIVIVTLIVAILAPLVAHALVAVLPCH